MIIDCLRQKLKCAHICTHMHTVWTMSPNSGLNADSLGNSMILLKRKKDLRAFSYFDNTVCVYLSRNFHTVCVYLSRNSHTVCVHLSFIDSSRSILVTFINPNSWILYFPKALSTLQAFSLPPTWGVHAAWLEVLSNFADCRPAKAIWKRHVGALGSEMYKLLKIGFVIQIFIV